MIAIILATVLLAIFLASLRIFLSIVIVVGHSMRPTLKDGDRLLVLHYYPKRWLKKGLIVVGKLDEVMVTKGFPVGKHLIGSFYIKRVTALSGESVEVHFDKLPRMLRETMSDDDRAMYSKEGKRVWHIPNDQYFVQGDGVGGDSRTLGPYPLSSFLGVLITQLPRHIPASQDILLSQIESRKDRSQ